MKPSLEDYFNFEFIDIILTVLNTPQIYRLVRTFDFVRSKYPTEYKTFKELNQDKLQQKMQDCSTPIIPLIDVYLTKFKHLSEKPKIAENTTETTTTITTTTNSSSGTQQLNMKALRIESKLIDEIEKFQSIPFLFKYDERLQQVLYSKSYPTNSETLNSWTYRWE